MKIDYKDLKDIRQKNKDKKIVVCAGWFDMFHVGHLSFLNNAKKNGDILVVVVMDDISVKPLKGPDRPVIKEGQRIEIVDNIKCVDYTILSNHIWDIGDIKQKNEIGNDYKEQLCWKEYIPIISELKPDSIFSLEETIAYDSVLKYLKESGINIIYTDYNNSISTTKIVESIK